MCGVVTSFMQSNTCCGINVSAALFLFCAAWRGTLGEEDMIIVLGWEEKWLWWENLSFRFLFTSDLFKKVIFL